MQCLSLRTEDLDFGRGAVTFDELPDDDAKKPDEEVCGEAFDA
jgi:hypothetical protein